MCQRPAVLVSRARLIACDHAATPHQSLMLVRHKALRPRRSALYQSQKRRAEQPMTHTNAVEIAATCHGVRVPQTKFLTPNRIARLNEGRYERDEIRGALATVGPQDRVLEIGAGIGIVGAVTARQCRPQKVMSFAR